MTELEALKWLKRCPGAELYVGVHTMALYIEGDRFMGNDLIDVVTQAIKAGY